MASQEPWLSQGTCRNAPGHHHVRDDDGDADDAREKETGLMLVTIIFFGSDLVQIILGDGWRSDTLFLLVISIPIFCKFIVSPISCIFLSHEQKKYVSYWQTLYFSVTFISLSILTLLKVSIETFLIGYAIGEIVLYSLYYYWAKKIAKSVGN